MTYPIVKKEQNISGDWSLLVDANGTILSLHFDNDPTQEIVDSVAQDFIDNPPVDEEEVQKMALTTRSQILNLNKVTGGYPSAVAVAAKGKSTTNMNSVNGGYPIFARGLGFDGNVNVSGTWKAFTNGFINVNGTWKELNELDVNKTGTWKS